MYNSSILYHYQMGNSDIEITILNYQLSKRKAYPFKAQFNDVKDVESIKRL